MDRSRDRTARQKIRPCKEKSTVLQAARKKIIICIDGTWCRYDRSIDIRLDEERKWSNVQKIRSLIAERDHDRDIPQIAFYSRGIGATDHRYNQLVGGVTGYGIDDQILDAYMSICDNYEANDEIYLIGFSRGAVAARALVGMIEHCGVLKADHIGEIGQLWKYFAHLTNPTRDNAKDAHFRTWVGTHTHANVRIQAIAVWDTVYGSEIEITKNYANRLKVSIAANFGLSDLRFRNDKLSPRVVHAFHALAIDERRLPFELLPWVGSGGEAAERVKQVWFAGSHSNVGGGYDDARLSDISLKWMISNLEHAGLVFHPSKARNALLKPHLAGYIGDPMSGVWSGAGTSKRSINVLNPTKRLLGEKVHSSALALHGYRVGYLGKNGASQNEYKLEMFGDGPLEISGDLVEQPKSYKSYCKELQFSGRIRIV